MSYFAPPFSYNIGGTGLSALGSPFQILRVKSDASGLEYSDSQYTVGGGAATIGNIALVSGLATVLTTAVKANSYIFLTRHGSGAEGVARAVSVYNVVEGVSFDINSANSSDTADVHWIIIDAG